MKRTLLKSIRLIIVIIFSIAAACSQKEKLRQESFIPASAENLTAQELSTIHTDTVCKYEYRTGVGGDYSYNYDVSGYDGNGNEVAGNVTMHGKYGKGTITTFDEEEIDVDVEWTGYGELKAIDVDGNEYELGVD